MGVVCIVVVIVGTHRVGSAAIHSIVGGTMVLPLPGSTLATSGEGEWVVEIYITHHPNIYIYWGGELAQLVRALGM